MGDTSVIARRLKDGTAEFGRSGDGGYFRNTGSRLFRWYQDPRAVDYLFGLGQTMQIGAVGSVHDQKDLDKDNPFSELLDSEDCKLGSISARNPIGYLRNNYYTVYDCFDKWIVIRCDSDYKSVTDILMRKKTKDHEETYLWDSGMQVMRLF